MRGNAWGVTSVAALALLASASGAGAAVVTVGSPLTASFTQTQTYYVGTAINSLLPEPGANVASPVAGAIRRWRFQGTGLHKLRVVRPNGDGTYTGVSTSAPVAGTGTTTTTTNAVIPIQAGDIIGIDDSSSNDTIGIAGVSGAGYTIWIPGLSDGTRAAPTSAFPGGEVAVNADVVPAPAVNAVSPAGGPAAGGSPVVLRGSDFTEASGVSFGGVAARSYTVDSDSQITAVAPAGAPGGVNVRVTTPSGTSATSDADRFIYAAPAATTPTDTTLPGAPGPVGALTALVGAPATTASGVRLTVLCAAPAGRSCVLVTRLVVVASEGRARAASVDKAKKAKRAYLTVGARKAKVKSGAKWTATVKLDGKGRRLLRRLGHLTVRVVTTSTTSDGERTALPTSRVTIKRR